MRNSSNLAFGPLSNMANRPGPVVLASTAPSVGDETALGVGTLASLVPNVLAGGLIQRSTSSFVYNVWLLVAAICNRITAKKGCPTGTGVETQLVIPV